MNWDQINQLIRRAIDGYTDIQTFELLDYYSKIEQGTGRATARLVTLYSCEAVCLPDTHQDGGSNDRHR